MDSFFHRFRFFCVSLLYRNRAVLLLEIFCFVNLFKADKISTTDSSAYSLKYCLISLEDVLTCEAILGFCVASIAFIYLPFILTTKNLIILALELSFSNNCAEMYYFAFCHIIMILYYYNHERPFFSKI